MSDIFREIDEELRRENFAKLWQRYGYYVVGLVVAAVIIAGLVVAWRGYEARQRAAEGERYQIALNLMNGGKLTEANAAFQRLAQDSSRRAVLARLEEAAILARSGDTTGAAARYETISADASVEPAFRDLATIMAAQYGLAKGDPKAIAARLQPLVQTAGPWQPSALELTALAQLKAGDKKGARTTFQRLADDLTAPQGLRSRAAEMLAALPK